MNQNNNHIDLTPLPKKHEELFSKMDIPFKKTKAEAWEELSNKIDFDKPLPKGKQVYLTWQRLTAVAAVVLLVLSSAFVLQTTAVTSLPGQQLTHVLPDGSKVFLNAGTEIRYRSKLWNIQREIELDGEAFFEVEKGEKFTVVSKNGSTEVLGTSFNIFSRKAEYEVYCKTGKVKVSNNSEQSLLLTPSEKVVTTKMNLLKHTNIGAETVLFWREGKIKFVSRELPLVLEELERQYNTKIHLVDKNATQLTYTGYFSRDKELDAVLNMMAISLNLTVKKSDDGTYRLN